MAGRVALGIPTATFPPADDGSGLKAENDQLRELVEVQAEEVDQLEKLIEELRRVRKRSGGSRWPLTLVTDDNFQPPTGKVDWDQTLKSSPTSVAARARSAGSLSPEPALAARTLNSHSRREPTTAKSP